MVDRRSPALPPDADPAPAQETGIRVSTPVDETGPGSFPASDPPAVWTWEVESKPADA